MRISDWSSDVCSSDLEISGLRADAAAAGAGLQRLRADLAKGERDLADRCNELMHATHALRLLRARQTLVARHGNGTSDIQEEDDKWPGDPVGPPVTEALSDRDDDGLREPPAPPYAAGQSPGGSCFRDGHLSPDAGDDFVMNRRIVDILADHERTLD